MNPAHRWILVSQMGKEEVIWAEFSFRNYIFNYLMGLALRLEMIFVSLGTSGLHVLHRSRKHEEAQLSLTLSRNLLEYWGIFKPNVILLEWEVVWELSSFGRIRDHLNCATSRLYCENNAIERCEKLIFTDTEN
jgi:hypothetical protein